MRDSGPGYRCAHPGYVLIQLSNSELGVIAREGGRSSIPETSEFNREASGMLDAPVKPGHDSGGDMSRHSRGTKCPDSSSSSSLLKNRAQGNAGARTHPQPCVQLVERTQASHHRYAETSGIPCAMVYGLWRTLPGVPGLIAPVASPNVLAELDLSVGRSGPHAFARPRWLAFV
jgi:hypothetical protein